MKNVKLMLVAFLFSAFPNTIQAQISEAQKAEMVAQFQESKERLQLTPEQEATFKNLSVKYAREMKSVNDSPGERREKFQKMKDIRVRKNTEMKGLLSESQYQTYLVIQEERIQRAKSRRRN